MGAGSSAEGSNMLRQSHPDPSSYANHHKVEVVKNEISWRVDFTRKQVLGSVAVHCRAREETHEVALDIRALLIKDVRVDGTDTGHSIEKGLAHIGDKLIIPIGEKKETAEFTVSVDFESQVDSPGLQWLTAQQTTDKTHPTVFTYAQPIQARAYFPCMDTPSVKCPFTVKISVPSPLQALVSAVEAAPPVADPSFPGNTLFSYVQDVPCPSYLVAFLVARLEQHHISPRIKVWAEPSIIKKAAWEFAEADDLLKKCEKIFGEFVWKRCDMVVLPESMPLGGMENPCMIYLNPTCIAGDRSLIDLLTHEQIHSWCGNLFTNTSWENMWINEGFTTYWERRIGGVKNGEQHRQFANLIAWTANLYPTVHDQFTPDSPFTQMVQDHTHGEDPNTAFSNVFYEKGQVFLYTLEHLFGQKDFDAWFASFLETFARKSLDTNAWRKHFEDHFKGREELKQIDIDQWLYGRGMPPQTPQYDPTLQHACKAYCDKWTSQGNYEAIATDEFDAFSSQQRIEFLNLLRQTDAVLDESRLAALENKLNLVNTQNCELVNMWLQICIKQRRSSIIPRAHAFITQYGRLKYIRSIYRELLLWSEARDSTRALFESNRPTMHPLSVDSIGKLVASL